LTAAAPVGGADGSAPGEANAADEASIIPNVSAAAVRGTRPFGKGAVPGINGFFTVAT
jgi:hypothetical protein